MKILFVTALMMLACKAVHAQINLDSAVCTHLVDGGQVDKTIDTITQIKEGEFLRSTNYFLFKKPTIQLSETISLEPVIFGCYTSHRGKNLLIVYTDNLKSTYYYYGQDHLLLEVDKIKAELLDKLKLLKEEDKAAIINYLSSCYL